MTAKSSHLSQGISSPVLRREDMRFVTGIGRYTNDIDVPGQVHTAFVRSDHAHGEICGIDFSHAKAVPGVLATITGEDLLKAGIGFIHRLPLKGFNLGKSARHAAAGFGAGQCTLRRRAGRADRR